MTELDELRNLREQLARLSRTRDPVARNNLAVDLIQECRRVLALVRRQAARDAVDSGVKPAEYARSIGVSRGAVDHLLRPSRASPASQEGAAPPEGPGHDPDA